MATLTCPRCECEKIVKAGLKLTTKGRKQIWQCKECGRVFTKDTVR